MLKVKFGKLKFLVLTLGIILSYFASAGQPEHFIVGHTWDGVALVDEEKSIVETSWLENGDLKILVDAPFANDPPPDCENTACWELWNFEVVELFLVGSGDPAPYTEIEISPWGNHLVLQLLGPRNTIAKELPLQLTVARAKTRWTAEAVLSATLLPQGDLLVNAYRVFGVEPNRHYQVMTPLGGDKPDFHRVGQFSRMLKR